MNVLIKNKRRCINESYRNNSLFTHSNSSRRFHKRKNTNWGKQQGTELLIIDKDEFTNNLEIKITQ